MTITMLTYSNLLNSKVSVITYNVRKQGVSLCCGNCCLLAFVLWCGYFLGSFGFFWIT